MATDESKIIVRLEAEVNKLTTELNKAQKKIVRFEAQASKSAKAVKRTFAGLGPGIQTALGGLGLAKLTSAVVKASAKQEQAIAQLRQGYETTGGAVGQSVEQMVAKAGELQKVTIFGDEQFIEAQSQLLTFTNIVGDEFDKTIEAAANLSVRMGQDLKSSVLQLGKALNDPVANLGALSRSGIQFSEDQKKVIKALAETGRLAEAQGIILAELETQFGGSARAAKNTFGGALQSLSNAFGDLLENNDGLNGATIALNDFTALLQDPQTLQAANALTTGLIKGFSLVVDAIRSTINVTKYLAEEMAATLNGVAADDIVRINEEITRLTGKVQQLTQGLNNTSAPDVQNLFKKQIIEAEEELKRLIELRDSYNKNTSPTVTNPPVIASGKPQQKSPPKLADFGLEDKQKETPYDRLNASLRESVALYGQSTKAAEVDYKIKNQLLGDLTEAQKQNLLAQAGKIDALEKEADISREIEAIRVDALSAEQKAIEDLQGKYVKLGDAVQAGVLAQEDAAKIAAGLADEFGKANKKMDEMSEYAQQAARNMQDAFADFLFDPFEDGLDGLLNNFIKVLQRMAAEAAAAQIFESIGNAASGSDSSIIQGIGSFFAGGAKANGGPVMAGMAYPIGEKGPEMFIPNVAGTIISNEDLQGGGVQVGSINMSFPGVTNAQEAKRASGAAGRRLVSTLDGARRYS